MRDQILIYHAEQDRDWLDIVKAHLTQLKRKGVSFWDSTQITPGEERASAYQEALSRSFIAILLVSPDFLASAHDEIIPSIIELAEQGVLKICWIPIRRAHFRDSRLAQYAAAWDPNHPLASLDPESRDAAFREISRRVEEAVDSMTSSSVRDRNGSTNRISLFVSYANDDKDWIDAVCNILSNYGYNIFTHRSVKAGAIWKEGLSSIIEDCDVFVAMISPTYTISGHQEEVTAALHINEKAKSALSILPVAFNIDIDQIPEPLSRYKSISIKEATISDTAKIIKDAIDAISQKRIDKLDQMASHQFRIKRGAADYIKQSQKALQEREIAYRRIAYLCYSFGALALVCGIAFSVRRLSNSVSQSNAIGLIGNILPYALFMTLLLALIKYLFTLGKSYMNEALRNSDRTHAISFGEFYLNVYSETAQWSEVKEAFQHWNIDQGSHFKAQETKEFDPKIIEHVIELGKLFASIKEGEVKNEKKKE